MNNSILQKILAVRFFLAIALAGCFHCIATCETKADGLNHRHKQGTRRQGTKNTSLIQAMERFKEAVRTQNGQLLLTCFSHRRRVQLDNPVGGPKLTFSFAELENDVKNRPPDYDWETSEFEGNWATFFLDPIPGLDDFTDFFFDYDNCDGPQPQWELVPGSSTFVHGKYDPKYPYPSIAWRKEGNRWVIRKIVYPSS